MCLDGFLFNDAMCSLLVKKLKERTERIELGCFELAGSTFNLDSPSQVAAVLFTRLKLPHPGGATLKKHMSTNKSVLEQMKFQHPIVEKILEYRRLRHAISQCIVPLQRFVCDDGFVRSRCEMHTSTGRILTFEPNLQNVPKDVIIDEISLRHLFTARPVSIMDFARKWIVECTISGCVLISADYSQLELRVLAHLSEDVSLIAHLSHNRDIFQELSTKWQVSRETVKKLCYGIIYGMGGKTLAENIKKSVEEGNKLMQSFFQSFPRVRSYINSTKEKSNVIILGRRRVTCSAKGRQEDVARDDRQSINYTIQGTASEIFKKALIRLEDTKKGAIGVVLTIHDEIIIECAADVEEETTLWMRQCLENVFPDFKVPLPVKIRSGPNWGSLSIK
ncbi:unnamed protein product [Strongylus vulgaris]|uniref:DNA-directed DNA polymerase n=1 Tax=Strongylus vulgaris TaxID=40348 RepID=A0A3P7HYG7_STRVU|nr:unnamed protein product [Strongylus vulgaris]